MTNTNVTFLVLKCFLRYIRCDVRTMCYASVEISADRNFWLAKVAGHGRKKFGQFGILGLEIA